MPFPFGEWVILFLTLIAWAEKRTTRCFFSLLTIAWLLGKWAETYLLVNMPWRWQLSRLAVMMVFWVWAFRRAERRFLPLFFASLVAFVQTLFFVNEPGVFPFGEWFFAIAMVLVAWLSAKSFWGTAAALTGGSLLNQVFVRFTYDGIMRFANLPDDFTWNLGVGLFSTWTALAYGWRLNAEKKAKRMTQDLVVVQNLVNCESSEEKEL
ncbi:hypothetical protein [Desulfosporosinus meridiei]|uniref:Uncharacterized protein n=1 Tax=Desulfosporosinus meridiei (strain ATCC BAA-275 / DSM 13257 / KCTC 12902 / NCIMB 13706 / S10) TaxID=768704 RepID=J7ISH5_DESMD|nr:hypothetical protein [Desulfosporosinus meridiei]AFQ43144.1 hypothetical protein Desmer_1122 [Desulfosporosinus meridiei DSM 13257]